MSPPMPETPDPLAALVESWRNTARKNFAAVEAEPDGDPALRAACEARATAYANVAAALERALLIAPVTG